MDELIVSDRISATKAVQKADFLKFLGGPSNYIKSQVLLLQAIGVFDESFGIQSQASVYANYKLALLLIETDVPRNIIRARDILLKIIDIEDNKSCGLGLKYDIEIRIHLSLALRKIGDEESLKEGLILLHQAFKLERERKSHYTDLEEYRYAPEIIYYQYLFELELARQPIEIRKNLLFLKTLAGLNNTDLKSHLGIQNEVDLFSDFYISSQFSNLDALQLVFDYVIHQYRLGGEFNIANCMRLVDSIIYIPGQVLFPTSMSSNGFFKESIVLFGLGCGSWNQSMKSEKMAQDIHAFSLVLNAISGNKYLKFDTTSNSEESDQVKLMQYLLNEISIYHNLYFLYNFLFSVSIFFDTKLSPKLRELAIYNVKENLQNSDLVPSCQNDTRVIFERFMLGILLAKESTSYFHWNESISYLLPSYKLAKMKYGNSPINHLVLISIAKQYSLGLKKKYQTKGLSYIKRSNRFNLDFFGESSVNYEHSLSGFLDIIDTLKAKSLFNEKIEALSKLLDIYSKKGDTLKIIETNFRIGKAFFKREPDTALRYFKEAYKESFALNKEEVKKIGKVIFETKYYFSILLYKLGKPKDQALAIRIQMKLLEPIILGQEITTAKVLVSLARMLYHIKQDRNSISIALVFLAVDIFDKNYHFPTKQRMKVYQFLFSLLDTSDQFYEIQQGFEVFERLSNVCLNHYGNDHPYYLDSKKIYGELVLRNPAFYILFAQKKTPQFASKTFHFLDDMNPLNGILKYKDESGHNPDKFRNVSLKELEYEKQVLLSLDWQDSFILSYFKDIFEVIQSLDFNSGGIYEEGLDKLWQDLSFSISDLFEKFLLFPIEDFLNLDKISHFINKFKNFCELLMEYIKQNYYVPKDNYHVIILHGIIGKNRTLVLARKLLFNLTKNNLSEGQIHASVVLCRVLSLRIDEMKANKTLKRGDIIKTENWKMNEEQVMTF